ncbi:MAG: TIGR03936 family radical SAM-associated protein [Olsenella sp.]|nr:TIGR03936 family radical SAM-associated protein [Olsenella sp.]MCI1793219.1 TIGR03936 family radical SAM-associated protein [Olsenella sp.]MCI1810262.1 TIGR03936 family radical SAM-associated protein [Olsenella sp.]MCI1879068.1 TIGR03936 family radical SAM-associated protein [Olsenella sp.]
MINAAAITNSKVSQYRLRVRYRKDGRLAYLGHLEVINTINRSVRRSQLPFAVGNGFARRMRLQFSQALPVGAASMGEYFDLFLTQETDPQDALGRIAQTTPTLLAPSAAAYVPYELPALEAWLTRSTWSVGVIDDTDVLALARGIDSVRAKGRLTYMRGEKEKHVDLARTLVSCETRPSGGGFLLDCRFTEEGSLRPAILLSAAAREAGLAMPAISVCRLAQWHEAEDGSLVEPM